MADLTVTDVTHAVINKRRIDGRNHNRVSLTFGDGAKTLPAAGLPIAKGKLGCPTIIESLVVVDNQSTYIFIYDQSAEKLVCYQTDPDGAVLVASTAAIAATTLECEVIGW